MKNSKMFKYIKNNKLFCSVMLLGFILLIIQMSGVVMYADDFSLKLISDKGWNEIFLNQYNHYFNWGGGFTPILVTSFLRGGSWLWKIFISFNILCIVGLAVKYFKFKTDMEKSIFATIVLDCFFFMSVCITKQTVFWLDGSMAYVFAAFQVFLYLYYFMSRLLNNVKKKYDFVLLPLVAFFAGWSSAQTGALVFIIPTLIMLYAYFIKKIKPKFLYHLTNIIGIIGFGIFYFAPGNAARLSVFTEFSNLSFIKKIAYRIGNIFTYMFDMSNLDYSSFPFFMLLFFALLVGYGIYIIKNSKDIKSNLLLKLSTLYLIIVLIIYAGSAFSIPGFDLFKKLISNFYNLYATGLSTKVIIQYSFCSFAILASLINCYYISQKEKSDLIIIFPIIMYCSQFVMLMAPYTEYRTELIGLIFLWVEIANLFIILFRNKINILYVAFIPFIIFSFYLIAFYFVILLLKKDDLTIKGKSMKSEYLSLIGVFSILALANALNIAYYYHENKYTYDANVKILETSKDKDVIYLYNYQYENYQFGSMVGLGYVEEPIRKLYNLKENAIFKYKEEDK